jgi:hypothetical protein
MKRILIAVAAFAALPAAVQAQDLRNPQPSFNDNAQSQYEAPARGAPSGRIELPQPSFVDYVQVREVAVTPVVATEGVDVRAERPQPSFNG